MQICFRSGSITQEDLTSRYLQYISMPGLTLKLQCEKKMLKDCAAFKKIVVHIEYIEDGEGVRLQRANKTLRKKKRSVIKSHDKE